MEETISLEDIFKTLKKRIGLIAFITVVAITIAGVVSFLVLTPIYQSSAQILVNQTKQETKSFNTQDIQTDLQLINTYKVIIKSPVILSKVIEELNLDMSIRGLNGKITASNVENSQVVTIGVSDPDPEVAVELANTIAAVFQEEIKEMMNVDNVTIIAPADLSESLSPVKPDPKLNMAIAAVIGLMLGVGLTFLLEYLDTTMKTEEDVEELLGIPIIGLVGAISEKDVQKTKVEVTNRRRRG